MESFLVSEGVKELASRCVTYGCGGGLVALPLTAEAMVMEAVLLPPFVKWALITFPTFVITPGDLFAFLGAIAVGFRLFVDIKKFLTRKKS